MSYSEWNEYKFEELTINYNTKRIPLSSKKRLEKQGEFNYYGAQGIIDSIDEYIFEGEYLLIAEDGANLETRNQDIARLTKENEKFWVNNHAHIVKSNKKSDIRYLKYFLNYSDISGYVTGSAQPKLNKANLNSIKIILPALEEQRAISKILSDLDEKIEVNNKINKNLEEMAQAIFKQWFVDFEFPNEEGKPYKSSGGEMVESELGMIPKGWKISSLIDIADYLNGLAMQKFKPSEDEKGLKVLKIKELRQGFTDESSDLCSENIKQEYIINNGDVIFSWSGTLLVDLWGADKCGLNQHLFKVTSNKYYKWYYYYWTKFHLNKFISIAKDKATTMGHIKRSNLSESMVFVPNDSTLKLMNKSMNPIITQVINNKVENRRLEKLRDTLLPKLMSGEIRVPLENSEN
ncbi:restriction endonuclease subunit S [Clostridium perfringens]|nr:restriction endonuclease subunit S [Clostridium perfringens]